MPVVAAVDQSDRAVTVVTQAAELADRYDVKLHVVHVGDPTIDFTDVSADALRSQHEEAVPEIVENVQQAASEVATSTANQVDDLEEYEAVGLIGEPSEVIRAYASEHDADYIVVSGRKRRALGQALFGSVSQSLLLNADCPVVSVPHDATDS
ncbi:universal stress protein [Natronobacterium gregoryi]|uniref:Stress response protein n=2 Tax=Natronobacterium gregoryi TaxID=44930 RepID=L0AL56_NATGS|nr:universal stress protein [Natronobacterium gregoryi]AFZ74608.1 universal stress protein UspA-like protein [Natronobacterium gregoryi SP2]ELY72570.1 stress response protein [Natronobacterium gregoryi SP2]PLK19794.1 universal stress protein [Natronobacterium gregoryi SP2]SFJ30387.1 Nucleotide-binding universal stress protein, UspA family [Natronobacterium gregoryi]